MNNIIRSNEFSDGVVADQASYSAISPAKVLLQANDRLFVLSYFLFSRMCEMQIISYGTVVERRVSAVVFVQLLYRNTGAVSIHCTSTSRILGFCL